MIIYSYHVIRDMSKIIKEIIIMLLVCLAIMIILALGLYQWIPNRKIIPKIEEYAASDEVKDLLEDDTPKKSEENGNTILTYDSSIEVTTSDLSGYEKSNDYVPRKITSFCRNCNYC